MSEGGVAGMEVSGDQCTGSIAMPVWKGLRLWEAPLLRKKTCL